MQSKKPLFSIEHDGISYAIVQAADAQQANDRATLIDHYIVIIPAECEATPVPEGAWIRGPVFYDGHFQAVEQAIKEFGD